MARIELHGLDEYERALERLEMTSGKYAGKAIYTGAGIVANSIRSMMRFIPITRVIYTKNDIIWGLTQTQIDGLKEGLGISKASWDGSYHNVKVGFAGYNNVRTMEYPNGQPNVLIARSLESGTSFRQKFIFISLGAESGIEEAEKEMIKIIDEGIKKAMEG